MEIELGSEYNLEISNRFYNSLDEILRYFLDISQKAHDSFKKDITACIDKIYVHPMASPILKNSYVKRQYRHSIYKKSYQIIYFVDEHDILLCDILHVKRNPKILKYLDSI
jgi:plasmid stabilization system protein ParE